MRQQILSGGTGESDEGAFPAHYSRSPAFPGPFPYVDHSAAFSEAESLSKYVRDVEEEMQVLQKENAKLKQNLIIEKRATLEKYLTHNNRDLCHSVLGEWKRISKMLKLENSVYAHEREIAEQRAAQQLQVKDLEDTLLGAHQERQDLEARLSDLRRMESEAGVKLRSTEKRCQSLQSNIANQEQFIAFMKGCMSRRANEKAAPAAVRMRQEPGPIEGGELVDLKDTLYAILGMIDPHTHYSPPVRPLLIETSPISVPAARAGSPARFATPQVEGHCQGARMHQMSAPALAQPGSYVAAARVPSPAPGGWTREVAPGGYPTVDGNIQLQVRMAPPPSGAPTAQIRGYSPAGGGPHQWATHSNARANTPLRNPSPGQLVRPRSVPSPGVPLPPRWAYGHPM